MSGRVEEIRGIEIRIQRIALNAAIRAAHTGAAGDALVTIAGAMQSMAAESSGHTEEVWETLEAMRLAVRCQWGEAGPDGAAGVARVAAEMGLSMGDLHSDSEISFARVAQIAELSERLAAGLAEARASFTAGAVFAPVAAHALAGLERVAAQFGAPAGSEHSGLDALSARYTMQAEREVHASALRGGEAASTETPPRAAAPECVPTPNRATRGLPGRRFPGRQRRVVLSHGEGFGGSSPRRGMPAVYPDLAAVLTSAAAARGSDYATW